MTQVQIKNNEYLNKYGEPEAFVLIKTDRRNKNSVELLPSKY
jgi:hypothetical protein